MTSFEDLYIPEDTISRLNEEGITDPTDVQEKSIPLIFAGNDVMVESETGSGKTLAFGLPMMKKVSGNKTQALILCPTRELAKQVNKEFEKFGGENTETVVIYGGVSYDPQIEGAKTANIIVGTPGRVLDLFKQGKIEADQLKYFVLDEADKMMDMGFQDELENIMSFLPDEKQHLLFSATIPRELRKMCDRYDINPETVRIEQSKHTRNLDEKYIDVGEHEKLSALVTLLKDRDRDLSLVFCRTKATTRWVTKALEKNGFNAATLNGDMSQHQREKTVQEFKDRDVKVIVATDVAARGIHVDNITHVFNYDVPDTADTYTHRVGRAGRQGNKGEAITLLENDDHNTFRQIKRKKDGIKRFGRDMEFQRVKTP